MAKSADAVSVAVFAGINQRVFQDTGNLIPTSKTGGNAQPYVTSNTAGFSDKGVNTLLTNILVYGGDYTVRVDVSADLSVLLPLVVP